MSERASIFDESDDLDLTDFKPKGADKRAMELEQVRMVSENAAFRSREPRAAAVLEKREPRRYRTGRNQQLNLKVRGEDVEAFYAIADAHGWVLGEAFARAIAALKREASDS